jgi:tetraacyldisaccharide 4'-kinase
MAKTLRGIPVLVGKDRFLNGQMALKRFHVRGLLLDDGYQYLQLHKDIDVLLIDSSVGFGDDHLLPRGILREPLSHLQRAHLFLFTKIEAPEICHPLEETVLKHHPSSQLFHSHYEPLGLIGPREEWEELHSVKGKKVLAFAGVANPDYFFSLVRKCGMEIVKEMIFPDHHHYTAKDLTCITEEVKKMDRIVTTEKDMVNLKKFDLDLLSIRALRIGVRIWEEEEFYQRLLEVFQKRVGM